MTPEEAIAKAEAGETHPVYLVAGEEQFSHRTGGERLRAAVSPSGLSQFNEERCVAGEVDHRSRDLGGADGAHDGQAEAHHGALARALGARPQGQKTRTSRQTSITSQKGALDRLADYAAAPVSTTCLVLVATKIDGSRKLMARARKRDWLVACEPLARGALPGFIVREAKERGHPWIRNGRPLGRNCRVPSSRASPTPSSASRSTSAPREPLTEDAIATCIIRMRQSTVWELIGAVGRRDLGPALALPRRRLRSARPRSSSGGVAWPGRCGSSSSSSRRPAPGRRPKKPPSGPGPLLSSPGSSPPRYEGSRPGDLERWLLLLAEADLELKGSKRPARATVEDTIVQMCRGVA